ncbi:MAG: hypothetical protein GY822_27120 [Deltaproteobacteria bacterium]|nr:hypothetical protein [Deltaproteobacteria bacterium]
MFSSSLFSKRSRQKSHLRFAAAFSFCVFALLQFSSTDAHAQFRNGGIHIGGGWGGYGTSTDFLHEAAFGSNAGWVATDQVHLNLRFSYAVPTFNEFTPLDDVLAFYTEVYIGLGSAPSTEQFPRTIVTASTSLAGVRYSFMDEKHRPYIHSALNILWFANAEGTDIPGSAVLGGQPMWLGIKAGGGYEFFFTEEMSVAGELNVTAYVGLDQPPKFSPDARFFFSVYY